VIRDGIEVAFGFAHETSHPRCWVIALGSNDVIYQDLGRTQADITEMVSRIPAGEPVWWMRVARVGGEPINALLPRPLIDWRPTSVELEQDEIHPNRTGIDGWVAVVLAALTQPR